MIFKVFIGALLAFSAAIFVTAIVTHRPAQPTPEQLALQEKSKEFLDLYKMIENTVVQQPTRPMADFEQPILKLHYLWLDVRNNAYWTSRAQDRAKIDAVVTKLVSDVARDKQVRQVAGQP